MGRDEEEGGSDKTWRATSLAAAAYRHTRVPTYLLGAALTIALLVVGSSSSSQPPAMAKTSDTARLRYRGAGQALEEYGRILREANDLLDTYNSKHGNTAAKLQGKMEGAEGGTGAPASDTSGRGHQMKDLVIGMAKDIEAVQVAVFAGSWREWSGAQASDVVLFINDPISKEMEAVLERFEVTRILFQEESLMPEQLRPFHPSSYRWPLINDYLEKHSGKYGRVLMADIRDTAFQNNPLDTIVGASGGEERLYTFHGVEHKTIGKCGWNGGWVKDCFGESVLESISDKPIICSGISMGTMKAVEDYVAQMTQNVLAPSFKQCERNGADQGVHNVLVHSGALPHVHVQDQRHGLVANMQARVGKLLKPEFKVVNQDAALYSVVHQYDRVPELSRFYIDKYVFWKSDLTDAANACEGFTLHKDTDLFKAECDLRTMAAADPSGCCVLCKRDPKCGGFTQFGSMCYLKTCTAAGRNSQALVDAVSGIRFDTQVERKV